jgi:small ligand-binding sensory domain FIST
VSGAREQLGDASVDLVCAFVSPAHLPAVRSVAERLRSEFPGAVLLGCSARHCIGDATEVEEGPSLSVCVASLPDVELHPFHVAPASLAAAGSHPERWRETLGVDPDARPSFVLLGDPASGDAEALIRCLEAAYPGAVQVGGLASASPQPGGDVLLLADALHRQGFVGLALSGDVAIDSIVAQGCRPVGQPMFVTRCDRNVIFELDGRRPLDVLDELAQQASERELLLFQTSLFIGIQMDPAQTELGRGDFLVRNVIGGDRDSGALAVGAWIEETQVVQFQLRDGVTAAEDLELRLSRYAGARYAGERRDAAGALLFSCLGRGLGMYGCESHDSAALQRFLGRVPVTGFFCNGEIGPVQGRPFLHGYTSAFGIFRPLGG